MPNNTNSKPQVKIILGISGGIAAYKCPDLVRRLKERNFDVRVVLTPSAEEFVTPMALQAVSGNPVHRETFDEQMEAAMGHIELAKWADYILIAPATANTVAKLVHGQADNLLTTIILASQADLVVAPAMNQQMWANQNTQRNIAELMSKGVEVLGPASGEQACGDVGQGRMIEPLDVAQRMQAISEQEKVLKGKKVVITAGPTVEAIDPVRYISNHSSGKMGYAIARAAQKAGANVSLVSGPVNIAAPKDVKLVSVVSAAEMFAAVQQESTDTDIFIGCAAVADYTPVDVAKQKIKKNEETMSLNLKRNPDILAWVAKQAKRPYVVGFAAESQKLKGFATRKLEKKKLDLICANDISCENLGFNSDDNQLLLLDKNGNENLLPIAAKEILAGQIIQHIANKISEY
ncbi:MAG: bifunctional phosphopantothenoylcysteine decarboxylase/phosphopantothenate--cysteine ligase CoaBC [Kangiellaceae bacterium]|nr:bifunctional phosphopantothenoylcysteine decarboxylase/phosphopantothenate--cysteine ligase CoaBC [Kangiellaceae bacterium]MCW8999438.1 bifunctional phosphopantothenoylcysteine decarboxylase/phosphopantothenate--cysteine ligase CoaBC [Kangiellaceae bacterium]